MIDEPEPMSGRELRQQLDAALLRAQELERQLVLERERNEKSHDFGLEMREYADSCHAMVEHWQEAFHMEQDQGGSWVWPESTWTRYDALLLKHNKLVADWNRFTGPYNAAVAAKRRNFGRPLAASHTQQADVLKRRKAGEALRPIADATGLSMRTVRTIIDKKDGVDRATLARLARIAPDKLTKLAEAREMAGLKARASLPKKIDALREEGAKLLKRAKGLGAAIS